MAYKLLSATPLTSSLSQFHGNATNATSPMLSLSAAAYLRRRDPGSDLDPPSIDENEDNVPNSNEEGAGSESNVPNPAAEPEVDLGDLEDMEDIRGESPAPSPAPVNPIVAEEAAGKPPTPPQSPLQPVATSLITTLSSFAPGSLLSEPLAPPSIVDTLSQAITRLTDDYIRDELLNSLMSYTEHRRRINNAKEEVSLLLRKQTFRADMAREDLELAQKRIRELRRHILERGVAEFRLRKLGKLSDTNGFRFRKTSEGSVRAGLAAKQYAAASAAAALASGFASGGDGDAGALGVVQEDEEERRGRATARGTPSIDEQSRSAETAMTGGANGDIVVAQSKGKEPVVVTLSTS